jgi:glycosyltransferase involved in cell wall biosynthesis
MNVSSRNGSAHAEIAAFTKGGRDFRLQNLHVGEETPLDFFYGFPDLEQAGLSAALLSSAGAVPGRKGVVADFIESAIARVTHISLRPLSAKLRILSLNGTKVVISYTDGFSLSLGLVRLNWKDRPVLIGGFHALAAIDAQTPAILRPLMHRVISRALSNLDHIFFFGAAECAFAIREYGLPADRCSLFTHGIDTEFWRPMPDENVGDFVAAVGQDPNRDFELLVKAPGNHPTVIVTRRVLHVPEAAKHIRVTAGDFFGKGSMSDSDLRRLYNQALAVVVPVKDVYQQSGYSVSIQAMSCGRPVIVSRTKGLWRPDLMRDGENCLLVPPSDANALGAAIARLRSDPALAARLGRAARETAVAHFGLENNQRTVELARLGLDLHAQRQSRGA